MSDSDLRRTPADPAIPSWWDTSPGRRVAAALVVLLGAATAAVKYGGVRAFAVDAGPAWAGAVLGWLPSFLTAFALPFVWPAAGSRVAGGSRPASYLPECLAGGGLVVGLEVLDLTWPGNVFAWSDLGAAVVGAGAALFVLRRMAGVPARGLAGAEGSRHPARPASTRTAAAGGEVGA